MSITMTKEQFEQLVSEATQGLPKEFLEKLENVAIVIQDYPSQFQLSKVGYKKKECILGLYEGVPQYRRGNYNRALPDKITLFQKNIEQIAGDESKVKDIIEETLWHEIGHHWGMNEEEVQKATLEHRKRKKIKETSF